MAVTTERFHWGCGRDGGSRVRAASKCHRKEFGCPGWRDSRRASCSTIDPNSPWRREPCPQAGCGRPGCPAFSMAKLPLGKTMPERVLAELHLDGLRDHANKIHAKLQPTQGERARYGAFWRVGPIVFADENWPPGCPKPTSNTTLIFLPPNSSPKSGAGPQSLTSKAFLIIALAPREPPSVCALQPQKS